MIENIFTSVIAFGLILLGVIEAVHCLSQKVAGWEAVYYAKRLRRRLLGLSLLTVIVLTFHFHKDLRIFFHRTLWNLLYLGSSLALVVAVFLLLVKDIMETARYALRKHAEITTQSLRRLKKSLDEKTQKGDE